MPDDASPAGGMITVARYFEPAEAHVVRALLDSAGLEAVVADEHHVTASSPAESSSARTTCASAGSK